jgi:hypothetical protein
MEGALPDRVKRARLPKCFHTATSVKGEIGGGKAICSNNMLIGRKEKKKETNTAEGNMMLRGACYM